MSTTRQQAITHLSAGEGETLWVLGDFVTLKSQSDDLTLFEAIAPPQAGPPPHVHYEQEEAFYVLEGTFTFQSGDTTIEARPGSFVWVPRGTVHTFKNAGPGTGKGLFTNTLPGAHERFFREVGVPVSDISSFQPPTEQPDIAKVMASGARNDIHFKLPAEVRG